jgi:hypothetical protein
MEVTHRQLGMLSKILDRYTKIKSVKVGYGMARNYLKLRPILQALDAVKTPSEDYLKFNAARLALCQKEAIKDDKGKAKFKVIPVLGPFGIEESQVYDFEDSAAVDALVEELKTTEEFKAAVEDFKRQEKEFLVLLDEKIDVEFHQILIAEVPDGIITMEDFVPLIESGIIVDEIRKPEETKKKK